MANFTITISNSMNLFGGSPISLWGSWNWNAFKWGEGTSDLPVDVMHLISESLGSDSAITQKNPNHVISESLSPTSEMTSERLTDGSGYSYIYPSNTTEAENAAIASYTSGSANSSSWTSAAAGSTTWS